MVFRKLNDEFASQPGFAFYLNSSVVLTNYFGNIIQAKPIAMCVVNIAGRHSEKLIEYLFLIFLLDTHQTEMHCCLQKQFLCRQIILMLRLETTVILIMTRLLLQMAMLGLYGLQQAQ